MISEIQGQLMEKMKECVAEEEYLRISSSTNLIDIDFRNDYPNSLWAGDLVFFEFVRENFDVRFYKYDAGKFQTIGELAELIHKKQCRKRSRNDPNKKHICYSATFKDGREYIGKTSVGLDRRKWQHANDAKKGKGGLFQNALKLLGEQNFEWKIEAEGNKAEIERREMELIAERNPAFNSQYIDFDMLEEFEKEKEVIKLFEKKKQDYFDKNGTWPDVGYMSADWKLYFEARKEVLGDELKLG